MSKKKSLKVAVYIVHDLTPSEESTAHKLRLEAKKLRSKGKMVKIGHQRIYVNGESYKFDPISQSVIQVNTTNDPKLPPNSDNTAMTISPSETSQQFQ